MLDVAGVPIAGGPTPDPSSFVTSAEPFPRLFMLTLIRRGMLYATC